MEGTLHRDDLTARPALIIVVATRDLQRALDCLGAGIREEYTIHFARREQFLRRLDGRLVVEQIRGVQQPPIDLLLHRLVHQCIAIAEPRHCDARTEIEVRMTARIVELDTLCVIERHRKTIVGLVQHLLSLRHEAVIHDISLYDGIILLHRIDAVLDLRQHAADQFSGIHHLLRRLNGKRRDEGALIIKILIHTLDIREEGELLGMHRRRDGTGRVIGVDVIALATLIEADRTDHRDEAVAQQVIDDGGIHTDDVSDEADILSLRVLLHALQEISILTGDTDGLAAEVVDELYQGLVNLVQHHLGDLHGILIGHTKSVHEVRLHAHLADPLRDLLATAMDDDRLQTDQLQNRYVLHDMLLQILIRHRGSAVLDDDDLILKFLDIWQCLDEGRRLIHDLILDFHNSPLHCSVCDFA